MIYFELTNEHSIIYIREEILKLVEILKTLGDLNRLRILNILMRYKKSCNCDLEESLELNQSNASRHMSKLKNDGVITCEKLGKWSYYSINLKIFEEFPFTLDILSSLDDEIFHTDSERFKKLQREKERCPII